MLKGKPTQNKDHYKIKSENAEIRVPSNNSAIIFNLQDKSVKGYISKKFTVDDISLIESDLEELNITLQGIRGCSPILLAPIIIIAAGASVGVWVLISNLLFGDSKFNNAWAVEAVVFVWVLAIILSCYILSTIINAKERRRKELREIEQRWSNSLHSAKKHQLLFTIDDNLGFMLIKQENKSQRDEGYIQSSERESLKGSKNAHPTAHKEDKYLSNILEVPFSDISVGMEPCVTDRFAGHELIPKCNKQMFKGSPSNATNHHK